MPLPACSIPADQAAPLHAVAALRPTLTCPTPARPASAPPTRRTFWARAGLCLLLAWGGSPPAARAQREFAETSKAKYEQLIARSMAQRFPPQVIRYDTQKDELVYKTGASRAGRRPGGDTAYYGNRLTQFQFLGPPHRGGLYEAIDTYYQKQELDPKKYQYRWGN
jgi:hypothetical protein